MPATTKSWGKAQTDSSSPQGINLPSTMDFQPQFSRCFVVLSHYVLGTFLKQP